MCIDCIACRWVFGSRSSSDSLNNYNQINDLSIGYNRCAFFLSFSVVPQIIIYFQSSDFWSPFVTWATPTKIDLFINFECGSFECCDMSLLFANQIHAETAMLCIVCECECESFLREQPLYAYLLCAAVATNNSAPFLFFLCARAVCMFYLALFSSKKLSAFSMVCAICGVQIRSPRP